jgi:ATP-dependent protease ClpP protease subunit
VNPNSWYAISCKADEATAEISIYDEIGGWGVSAQQFLTEIGALKGRHLHVRINSPGGSITEGNAIFNALRRHEGGVTVHIDGMAASMASVIAMAGMPTLIADNAWIMIHNPWTIVAGESEALRKAANLLDGMKQQIVGAYQRKTGQAAEILRDLMDQETWLSAIDAVAMGFADAIEEGVPAAASINPAALRARFDNFAKGKMSASTDTPAVKETVAPLDAPIETIVTEATETTPPIEEASVAPENKFDLTALVARIDGLVTENQNLRADLDRVIADQDQVAQNYFRLKASLGLAAAVDQPEITPAATVANDPVAQYREMLANNVPAKERHAFFQKHQAVLVAAIGSGK